MTATGSPALWQASGTDGVTRPVVFFYGAEFAPYAAAQRWPVIVALSRFGTFGAVGLITSDSFGSVYNGGSERERAKTVAGWRIYLHYQLGKKA